MSEPAQTTLTLHSSLAAFVLLVIAALLCSALLVLRARVRASRALASLVCVRAALGMQIRLVSLAHSRTPFTPFIPFPVACSIPLTCHSPRHSLQRDDQMHRRGLQNGGREMV